ncbi:toll/interleukin-1 receptor domain-containing protein [Streptomyces triculaminicus]|uniref:Toll/interleukin-1 receptor domain-containing protein n=2 Tax=Streptomyces TaxID=1883 RepID=A0A939FIK2_9ACTN|nr:MULTISPECIES: toll/interleukin-1 receptor domain-containing protein [Streptomyces]MBO0651394.1 toll/interleukin-1 receptor domain-containing protein [Streptomyces triculaminicus]QSY49704.1 toll/interleukin-1 receptor domain-containing protein [Streptomyces griseocarneus]
MGKVFISHCTNRDRRARALRDRVAERLHADRYEVLLDARDLRPGEEWRPKLYAWLRECRAAVVLLNRDALKSGWVRREVDILMWRRSFNRSLFVMPLLVDDVTTQDVRDAGMEDLAALQVARVRYAAGDQGVREADIAELLAGFRELPAYDRQDPVSAWTGRIEAHLTRVWDARALTDAGRALRLPDDGHDAPGADLSCGLLAAQMLHTHAAAQLRDAVGTVRDFMDPGVFGNLVELVLPVWVDAASARHVLPAGRHALRHTVVLKATHPDTGAYYLGRAFCMDASRYISMYAGAGPWGEEDPEEELKRACEETIRATLHVQPWKRLDEVRRTPDCLTFLVLDAQACSLEQAGRVVGWLHDLMPWLCVLVLPHPAQRADPGPFASAVDIAPPFGEAEEEESIRAAAQMVRLAQRSVQGMRDWGRRG